MNNAIENLTKAFERAMAIRPKVGGFPYLAETLRQAGVRRNLWYLPSCQSVYLTDQGPVVSIGTSLTEGMTAIPPFDGEALIAAIRTDQAGESTFPEFLSATWKAGIVSYDVDFTERTCTYFGAAGGKYVESYPAVDLP
jgi:uncharacterized protein YbcV (DUF1398 family)